MDVRAGDWFTHCISWSLRAGLSTRSGRVTPGERPPIDSSG